MGELGKISRWSVPGAVFLLGFAATVGSARAALLRWDHTAGTHVSTPALTSSSVALLFGASVPIGFLIYQLYYAAYARPRGMLFSYVHRDIALEVKRSGHVLRSVTEHEGWRVMLSRGLFIRFPFHTKIPFTRTETPWLFSSIGPAARDAPRQPGELPIAQDTDVALGQGFPWAHPTAWYPTITRRRAVLADYAKVRESNWLELETEFYGKLRDVAESDRDVAAIERLADIYHTLGASKSALSASWASAAALVIGRLVFVHALTWSSLGIVAASLVVMHAVLGRLYKVLHDNRTHCLRRRIAMILSVLSAPKTATQTRI